MDRMRAMLRESRLRPFFLAGGSVLAAALIILAWEGVRPRLIRAPAITAPLPPTSSFKYTFNVDGVLQESARETDSPSPYFWLNSGGELRIENGVGYTLRGPAPSGDRWRTLYAAGNALDTEDGRYPQNLFRLVTRQEAEDVEQFLSFRIEAINTTRTENRGPWSGIFLMARYGDGDNLYYLGLRQDGFAVIKKKVSGVYHTLAETAVWQSDGGYEADTHPNLIPGKTWMAIRSRVVTQEDGVRLELYLDRTDEQAWEPLLAIIDHGVGGPPLYGPGRSGIRTDFMDVAFDNFTVNVI